MNLDVFPFDIWLIEIIISEIINNKTRQQMLRFLLQNMQRVMYT